ncbi:MULTISPECIES: alkene reductase [Nostoc]|uniref:Alkene reductase n=1 Tax=Nostoc paludosum FACHB-159 TaxID=2692908 RepID=A0ABR8KJU2_9NOSO|nr:MULTISPECIES: alkene reductase [Nostoc]MBD2681957.1 alkene reductase [Nostoc sp. FACHB-857]MBD2738327.1 alkene reductase [Nostoc paludosum FACHB-159]
MTQLTSTDLFSPVHLGPYILPNRIVMAPMTRNRAGAGNAPTPINATYYAQRATAGLIVSEGSQVSPQGFGYPATPGIHSPEQIAGWQLVTDAVHNAGGRIFLQLWHTGRISHPSLQPDGALPVAPSAIAPAGNAMTYTGNQPFVTPRALETEEIPDVVDQFRQGAKNALAAGFDGVEIHGAFGYLIDQFLQDGTNQRSDMYGGSIKNRARFLLEVVEAVTDVWGANRVGIKLSPSNTFNDIHDSDPKATFSYAIAALNSFELGYLHLMEPTPADIRHGGKPIPVSEFRPLYAYTLIANGGYDREKGNAAIANGDADLVSFGALFLANPDLPERLRLNTALNEPDRNTFYGGDEKGYTDYPFLYPTTIIH